MIQLIAFSSYKTTLHFQHKFCSGNHRIHSCMPVIIWNPTLALEWIHPPSQNLKEHIASDSSSDRIGTACQPVSKCMSNFRYQGIYCKKHFKLEKVSSISSLIGQSHNARSNGEVDKKVPCLNQSTSQIDCNVYDRVHDSHEEKEF